MYLATGNQEPFVTGRCRWDAGQAGAQRCSTSHVEILGRNNSLVVTSLEEDDCTLCPNFVMVDYAELEYRVRP